LSVVPSTVAQWALAADVVFLSAAALPDPEHTLRDVAGRGRAEVVVATAGAEGACLMTDDELTHIPPVTSPAPVIDSNGAGDAFATAFLLGRLTGEPPQRCALYGAVAGAHACTVPSTETDAITRDALLVRTG
jgi:sugar/nucleoside kinase (ribokinase family)